MQITRQNVDISFNLSYIFSYLIMISHVVLRVMNTNRLITVRFNFVSTPDGTVFFKKRNIALLIIDY